MLQICFLNRKEIYRSYLTVQLFIFNIDSHFSLSFGRTKQWYYYIILCCYLGQNYKSYAWKRYEDIQWKFVTFLVLNLDTEKEDKKIYIIKLLYFHTSELVCINNKHIKIGNKMVLFGRGGGILLFTY